jgi:phosphatidate phosphatase PAH1
VSKDLQDETVALWVKTASCEWIEIGRAITNSDGRARVEIPADLIARSGGKVELRWVVPADLSSAPAHVTTVRTGQGAVVFDVDGTLTTSDSELFDEILTGADPEMYPGAPAVVAEHLRRGRLVIYLTGRPYLIRPETLAWLKRKGFPQGPVVMVDSLPDALPSESGVETFKLGVLNGLRDTTGVRWVAAYGNASTDVCAYARAGIDPARTFIIGDHAGSACNGYANTQALPDYLGHVVAEGARFFAQGW